MPRSRAEVVALQTALRDLGFDPGPIDGRYGQRTRAAYQDYLDTRPIEIPVQAPPAPKPWWRTGRFKGLLLLVFGVVGVFVPALREMDVASMVELVWANLDHVERLVASVSALAVVAGQIWSAIGAGRASAPVDPGLVARLGDRELRLPWLPERVRDQGVSSDADPRRGPFRE